MKKGLLSLLALALTVVGCQNYDDQFDELTSLIEDLQTEVEGLPDVTAQVNALQSTVDGLATAASVQALASSVNDVADDVDGLATSTALADGLAGLQTQIDALVASLADVADADDIAAINAELTSIQEDLDELLAANATINQSITINSLATLQYAESLISTDPTDPNVIVNGNVTVDVNQAFATTAGVSIDRINAVTNKFATVLGTDSAGLLSVSYTASPSIGGLTMNNLVFVDTDLDISGSTATAAPELANVTGAASITYTGAIAFPTPITITGALVVGADVTSLDFTGGSAASLASAGDAAGVLDLPNATSIDAGNAVVTKVTAPKATSITLGKAAALAELVVTAAKMDALVVEATSITGTLTVSGQDSQTTIDLNDITSVSGVVTIGDAASVGLAKLTTINNNATIGGNDVAAPLLATVTGTLEVEDDKSVALPKFAPSTTTTFTVATTASLKSASSTLLKAPKVESLTITAQDKTTSFDASSANYPEMTSINITGVEHSTPLSQSNNVTITGTELETAVIAGYFNDVIVDNASELTDLTVNGNNNALTINNNAELDTLVLGHDHIEGADAHYLTVSNNAELTSVAPTALEELGDVLIHDNAKLATIDLSSADGTSPVAGSFTVSISSNALVGRYIAATAQSTTTDYVQTVIKNDDLLSVKAFIDDKASGVTYNYTLDVDTLLQGASGSTTKTIEDSFSADSAQTTATGIINTAYELGLLAAE